MAGYESGISKYEGITVIKDHTCNGNGAQTDNIFKLTGLVEIKDIYGICTEATNSIDFADCSFQLWNATPETVEITDANVPTDASGIGVGGGLCRNGASATVALAFITSDACTITDVTHVDFLAHQKPGVDTYIRFLFNGDANTDIDMRFYCRYIPKSEDGKLEAV